VRILQALHFFLPNHVAGVEVYTDRLAAQLSTQHDVGILYTEIRRDEPNYTLRRLHHGRAQAYEITNNLWFRRFDESYHNPALLPAISLVLDEFAPDVVHVQHLMGLSLTLIEELRRRSIPTLMTVHDHWLECAAGGQRFHRELGRCDELDQERCGACTSHMSVPALRARAFVEGIASRRSAAKPADASSASETPGRLASGRWLKRACGLGTRLARVPTARQAGRIADRWRALLEHTQSIDRFLVPSRYLADELVQFGLPEDRILQLEHGFPSEGFSQRRRLPDVARRFAFLGSLVRHKGVHVLLEAFAQLPPDLRLDLCGFTDDDPAYVTELKQRWRHPGIRFLGRLATDQVPSFLATSDCLIVPSIWCENAPLVIREAHLAGLPVVASRLGGHTELLQSGGGLLYDADSSTELAACLRRLFEEPGLLRELADSAPPVKSIEEHVAELVGLYQAISSNVT